MEKKKRFTHKQKWETRSMFLIYLSLFILVSCFTVSQSYCALHYSTSVPFFSLTKLSNNSWISQCHSRTLIILCRTCYVAAEFSKKKGGFEKKRVKILNTNLGLWHIASINFFYIYKIVIITEILQDCCE